MLRKIKQRLKFQVAGKIMFNIDYSYASPNGITVVLT